MLKPGDILAGYQVEDIIDIGGMGVVYRAVQISLERPVALKVMSPQLLRDQRSRERFRREGRHAARLDHPNIITVYEADEEQGTPFIAMKLIDGETLDTLIANDHVDSARTLSILTPIADALDYAHSGGLVHRDVKPANILVSRRGHPYLADFGITKALESQGITATGRGLGSLAYAAPEQISGDTINGAADIYALAAVIYECLTGAPPFVRDEDAAVIRAHSEEPPPKVGSGDQDHRLDEVIARGLAKDPGARFASATELVAATRQALDATPSPTDVTPTPAAERIARSAAAAATITSPGHEPEKAPKPPATVAPATAEATGQAPSSESRRPITTVAPPSATEPRSDDRVETPARPTRTAAPVPAAPVAESASGRPQPAPSAPRRVVSGAMLAIGVVVAAAAGLFLAGGSSNHASAHHVSNTVVELSYGAEWKPAATGIPGLDLKQPLKLADTSRVANLSAGLLTAPSAGRDPAPASLKASFAKPVNPMRVRLGQLAVLEYDASLKSGAGLRLFLVPTSSGYVAVSCRVAGAQVSAAWSACDRVATTLTLRGGTRGVGLAPDAAYGASLQKTLSSLDQHRRQANAGLKSTSTSTRAKSAARLSNQTRAALAQVNHLHPVPQDAAANKAVAAALGESARDLDALAAAARAKDDGAYNQARSQLAAADQHMQQALAQLAANGYRVTRGD